MEKRNGIKEGSLESSRLESVFKAPSKKAAGVVVGLSLGVLIGMGTYHQKDAFFAAWQNMFSSIDRAVNQRAENDYKIAEQRRKEREYVAIPKEISREEKLEKIKEIKIEFEKGSILGKTKVEREDVRGFLLQRGRERKADPEKLSRVVDAYYDLSSLVHDGLNPATLLIKASVETDYFSSRRAKEDYNFCGLGAASGSAKGIISTTLEEGVMRCIIHACAYATQKEENCHQEQSMIDGRFKYVKRGSAPSVFDMGNKVWAEDPRYADKIKGRFNGFLDYLKTKAEKDASKVAQSG